MGRTERAPRPADPLGVRRARRPAERRQVDARQRDRRRQGGDRLRQAADHPPRDPRRRHRTRLAARARRPARRAASARRAHRADAAPRRARAGRRRRLPAGGQRRAGDRPGRPLHRRRCCAAAPVPVAIAVNKVDRADRARTAAALCRPPPSSGSATRSSPSRRAPAPACRRWSSTSSRCCPPGPFYFSAAPALRPDAERSMLAELVREQVLARTREEVPHAVEVEIEEIRRPARRTWSGSRRWCWPRPSRRRGS